MHFVVDNLIENNFNKKLYVDLPIKNDYIPSMHVEQKDVLEICDENHSNFVFRHNNHRLVSFGSFERNTMNINNISKKSTGGFASIPIILSGISLLPNFMRKLNGMFANNNNIKSAEDEFSSDDTLLKLKKQQYGEKTYLPNKKVVNKLMYSINNLPKEDKAKRNFLKRFFSVSLNTGKQMFEVDDFAIDGLMKNNSDDLKYMLEHMLKMAVMNNKFRINPYEIIEDMDVCKNIINRNLYSYYVDFKAFKQHLVKLGKLSDDEWEVVKQRNLMKITNNDSDIVSYLANVDDEKYLKIQQRGILSKCNEAPLNIINLAELNDNDWSIIVKRNIDIGKIHLGSNSILQDLLSITDEKWEVAQKRGLFQSKIIDNDFHLLNLSDTSWENIEKRDLRRLNNINHLVFLAELSDEKYKTAQKRNLFVSENDFDSDVDLLELSEKYWENIEKRNLRNRAYSVSLIRLAQLTDEEYNTARQRGLIDYYRNVYWFNMESEFLTKLDDDKYKLFLDRKLDEYCVPLDIKQDILNMDKKQYANFQSLLSTLKKNADYEHYEKIDEIYKLAYLDNDDFNYAEQLLLNFDYNEIQTILNSKSENRVILKNILDLLQYSKEYESKKNKILPKFIQFNNDKLNKIIQMPDYISIDCIAQLIINNNLNKVLNFELLKKNKDILLSIKKSKLSCTAQTVLISLALIPDDLQNGIRSCTLKQRMVILKNLKDIKQSPIFENNKISSLNIDGMITLLKSLTENSITPTEVSTEAAQKMHKGFFANNNPQLEKLLSTTDFTKYGKQGLPLEYSRKQFIEDLNNVLTKIDSDKQNDILTKLGITLTGDAKGYDGIIDLTKLSKESTEGQALLLATKFIKENSIQTGNKELDKALNSLIQGMPEFINTIGKQQHGTHDFSLDVHTLTVLKEAMANPNYKNLNPQEKTCLKFATIMHDIAKSELKVDEEHPINSALYARNILNKSTSKMPVEMKDRIFELIKNHHWLKDYAVEQITKDNLAVLFRRDGDLKIAQIMAEADLKGVSANGSFYNSHKKALDNFKQDLARDILDKMYSKGQAFFLRKIIVPSKIPTVIHNGKEYKVINFTQLDKNTDLSQYGFEKGTTLDNLRLFIHTVNEDKISNLEIVDKLQNPFQQGVLCASYVSVKNHPTYYKNVYGVSLECENVNIVNADYCNQGSGYFKDLAAFSNIVKSFESRELIPNYVKRKLKLTNDEYTELYKKIQSLKYVSQLENFGEVSVGNKVLRGVDIKNAYLAANDEMINRKAENQHNEANLYAPKINAVTANVNSIEEIPQQLLDFAKNRNLPIFILGKNH